ncbi:hypothetical protein Q8F55_004303 [Vanrija albida]|uniref:beta-mannosidase n=1 Tax=Vanrija albida TaxID=181172 RepID=A0ABR3Q704_9TREE
MTIQPRADTRTKTALKDGWAFSQVRSAAFPDVTEEWTSCAVPTSVHVELERAGKIPDVFKGLAEWDVQWIQEADWTFKTTFAADSRQQAASGADLVFEGLDTYCTIVLNGETLASTSNMFHAHRFSVAGKLKDSNALELRFASPWYAAKAAEAAHGGPRPVSNGDSCRLYSRKAQYGWGWDWGPVVMTVGPWQAVHLETYEYRVGELRVDAGLGGEAFDKPWLAVAELQVEPQPPADAKVVYTLSTADGAVVKQEVLPEAELPSWDLVSSAVQAWYPVHYGKQPLYSLHVAVLNGHGDELASTSQRVAFRDVQVIQQPLPGAEGTSFVFQVNGIRIFCGGSNWIPADSYLTNIKPERYRAWVDLLVAGNQNMLRVWAGGVYEPDVLYDACDERGVLVWQDFMFGCGVYPAFKDMVKSVQVEAETVVKRLRQHPSVVIFAGNNEDYQVAEEAGVVDYNDKSGKYLDTPFPARHFYEVLLPDVVHRLSTVFYWPGSPYGGKTCGDLTVGDQHQWNVWHGTQEPWANWDKLAGRFVSEFGMQGYPDVRTVREWFAPGQEVDQWFPQSRVSTQHNKATGFERRLELYLMENFRHAFDMESYIYYTQIMQAECLAAAYRLWRRNWKGRGREYTAGALVWQINDCWPCVSWAICDYYLRPKPAYFAIARELRPYTVGMTRKEIKTMRDSTTAAFYTIRHEVELWGCNSTVEPKAAKVELVSFDLNDGVVDKRDFPVVLQPNASMEIWKGDVPGQPVRTSVSQAPRPIVVQAVLRDGDGGSVLARYSNWPEPWKSLTFPEAKLKLAVNGDTVTVTAEKPIKGLVLDVEGGGEDGGDEVQWSDQALDVMPGDAQTVTAKGLGGRSVVARHLGDGSA